MYGRNIQHFEPVLILLLILVVVLALLAKRFRTPYPIILVIGGLLLSLLPRMPHAELNPEVVFLVFLPPLLFSAAFQTSWRDFRYNLVSILMLAFGLVGFTVFCVAAVVPWILPKFNWHLGLVLGAVICTTDAIAATSIARRLSLPRRIRDVIEGESLVNDVSGLVALQFAVAIVVTGNVPSAGSQIGRLLYLIASGIAIGFAIGKIIYWVEKKIDDAPIEITISLITPYLAYLAAESVHSSGVLATVVCGLYLGHESSIYLSTRARLQAAAVWETLNFALNGIVFILIGLQLPYILSSSVGIPRRADFVLHSAPTAGPAGDGPLCRRDFYSGLGWNARSGGAGRGDFSTDKTERRRAFPTSPHHHFPHILRHIRNSRVSGTHAAAAHSPIGSQQPCRQESGGTTSAHRDH